MATTNAIQLETQSQSQTSAQTQLQHPERTTAPNEAATKLIESIDDFLADIEKKFQTIGDEIFTRLDDMADRCDRLEQEMLLGASAAGTGVDSGSGPGSATVSENGAQGRMGIEGDRPSNDRDVNAPGR